MDTMSVLRWVLLIAFYAVAELASPLVPAALEVSEPAEEAIHHGGQRRPVVLSRSSPGRRDGTTATIVRPAPVVARRASARQRGSVRKVPAPALDAAPSPPEDH
jgi:hypothetical protein